MKNLPNPMVYIGRVVELKSSDKTWTFKKSKNCALLTNPNGTKLVIHPEIKFDSVLPNHKYAKSRYKIFHDRPADSSAMIDANPSNYTKKGRAEHIVYWSDKWNEDSEYIHHFDYFPIIWVNRPNRPTIFVLTGGQIRVTERGIEG